MSRKTKQSPARHRGAFGLAVLCAVALVSLLVAGSAFARTITPYEYSGTSFDGTGSTAGVFQEITAAAVDQSTGDFYVLDQGSNFFTKFDAAGNPAAFSSLAGASSIDVGEETKHGSDIAVDNSGGPTQGRVYVSVTNSDSALGGLPPAGTQSFVHGFDSSGATLGGNWPLCGAAECGMIENWASYPAGVGVASDGNVWIGNPSTALSAPHTYNPFQPGGTLLAPTLETQSLPVKGLEFDSSGNFYAIQDPLFTDPGVAKFAPSGELIARTFSMSTRNVDGDNSGDAAVDDGRNLVFVSDSSSIEVYDLDGRMIDEFGAGGMAVAVNESTGDVYTQNGDQIDIFEPGAAVTVPDVSTDPPTSITGELATLHGELDPDGGGDTTVCRFEWGINANLQFGGVVPCAEGQAHPSAGGPQQVSANITGLQRGSEYHYRLVVGNGAGPLQYGEDLAFRAADSPTLHDVTASQVNADAARIIGGIDPRGGNTTYVVEYGLTAAYGDTAPAPPVNPLVKCFELREDPTPCDGRLEWGSGSKDVPDGIQNIHVDLQGLTPNATYHYRLVAENDAGTTTGPDQTFHTFDSVSVIDDPCPNKLARQQTGAAQLLDCRAYELVSAANAGGYDVESDLGEGQHPLAGHPNAQDKALYAVNDGGIPGVGNPTNRGPDPYVATRDAANERWNTSYVGIPADAPSDAPFSSTLADADDSLSAFAFGGPELCDPCFADGSIDVPLRTSDGVLGQGMQGSLDPGPADPQGEVRKHFSADGSHFVFGTDAQFEPDGNSNGDTTIYDRNLSTGETQVVSKLPNGDTMAGPGIAQLDISDDGERIVVGQLIGTDAAGNDYYHPYMHVGTSPNTIDLAPGTTTGVIYNGMTSDGSMVFFSSPDQLTGDDTDASIDVFRADVNGAATLHRVSTGTSGTGDTDACAGEPNSENAPWNTVDGTNDCSAMPIAGGGGIATEAGDIYFLSPEQLDGNGNAGEPNLFLAKPGDDPRFITTLESASTGPTPLATSHPFTGTTFGSFANPAPVAVHEATGNVFVADLGTGEVKKFDADGNPENFTSLASNTLGGFVFFGGLGQIAVDNSGGPTDGNLYVTDVNAFAPPGGLHMFDSVTGAVLGAPLFGFGAPQGFFFAPTGVAVDDQGRIYIADIQGFINRYVPAGAVPAEGDYDDQIALGAPQHALAADSTGAVYAHEFGSTGVTKYSVAQFGAGSPSGTELDPNSRYAAVDPSNDHVYLARGTTLAEHLPSEEQFGIFGSGDLTNSNGVVINGSTGRVYATDAGTGNVKIFETVLGADRLIDSPPVIHAVSDAETRDTADFQVNPSGSTAAIPSTIALTGYPNRRHQHVFLYDSAAESLTCVSCSPTNATSTSDSSLATNGLSITDDGRVFFNSGERLVQRDGNGRQDVYEFSDDVGRAELISTGVSDANTSLLSVTADGSDAFFFTRRKLVPQDLNGPTVKLYTAREGGGFFRLPDEVECQASDECHGPGTEQADPATIATVAGTEGQVKRLAKRCNTRRLARRARKYSQRAKTLRRRARRARASNNRRATRRLNRAIRRNARRARRTSGAAKRCRAAQRARANWRAGK